MQENLSDAAERLASRLIGQWGEELRRSVGEELQPVLEAEITRAGHEAAFVIASDLVRLLQAANQVEILSVLLQTTQPFAAQARVQGELKSERISIEDGAELRGKVEAGKSTGKVAANDPASRGKKLEPNKTTDSTAKDANAVPGAATAGAD